MVIVMCDKCCNIFGESNTVTKGQRFICNSCAKEQKERLEEARKESIFSGLYSESMWGEIHTAKSVDDLRVALYLICCRIQELESVVREEKK